MSVYVSIVSLDLSIGKVTISTALKSSQVLRSY